MSCLAGTLGSIGCLFETPDAGVHPQVLQVIPISWLFCATHLQFRGVQDVGTTLSMYDDTAVVSQWLQHVRQ